MNKIFYKAIRSLHKAMPTILTISGVVGVIGTSVLSGKASIKAYRIIKNEKDVSKEEFIRKVLPVYIPTTIAGLVTIGCIIGSSIFYKRNITALTALAGLFHKKILNKEFEPVKKKYDEQWFEVAWFITEDDKDEVLLFSDMYRGRIFQSTKNLVLQAQYHLNRNFALKGYANINEFYDFLGLASVNKKEKEMYEHLGWSFEKGVEDGYSWIDFKWNETDIGDGTMCYVIDYPFKPSVDYI